MKRVCTRVGTSARRAAATGTDKTLPLHAGNGTPYGIQLPSGDLHSDGNQLAEAVSIPPTADAMSMIGIAICRSLLLWFHLGIGPIIGGGPMQASHGRPKMPSRPIAVGRHANTFALS
jgi:hypothetical protein